MFESIRKSFAAAALFLLLSAPTFLTAQVQQANCTFKLFTLPGLVQGVNDYGTTVGFVQDFSTSKGFIRYSNGSVSYYRAPNAAQTILSGRNNSGVSVGTYTIQGQSSTGFILSGSKLTPFSYPNATRGTTLRGINKYNTTVGWATDANYQSHGFKRYSNGSLVNLQYPGSSDTMPAAINDHGTIVGQADEHGFIYSAGTWARVDYPNSTSGTQLTGISNANVMVGQASNTPIIGFLYANGVFKNIAAPNSNETIPYGISPDGLITGITFINGENTGRGFLATCK